MSTQARQVDYVIIGAGPGGLQLGYYLQKRGRDYVILERGNTPGHFFTRFPRHRKLISTNKVYTGFEDQEINLRWDWNSLLTDEDSTTFKEFSKEYFPPADAMVSYCEDFARRHQLRVECNAEVRRIRRNEEGFLIQLGDRELRARRVIMATGRSAVRNPEVSGAEHIESYDNVSVNPDDFINQRVLILGKGNSAFETADNLVGVTASIHMLSPNPIRMAWKTHYVGDLRAVNNNLLDTYQLKSQNTIIDANLQSIERLPDGMLHVKFKYTHAHGQEWELKVHRIIACTGFGIDRSIFDAETCWPELNYNGRFPSVTSGWESTNVKDLFFAGALMHGRDYRKGFSGFIHGFRYSVECLGRLLEQKYEGAPLETKELSGGAKGLSQYILDRVTRCSSLFQQPGYLSDTMLLESPEASRVYRDLPVDYVAEQPNLGPQERLMLTLEYGKIAAEEDPFNITRVPDDGTVSRFIHPVLRHYRGGNLVAEHHVPEDLENNWNKPMYLQPLERFLESVVSR
jgi:thioredoxin reductase